MSEDVSDALAAPTLFAMNQIALQVVMLFRLALRERDWALAGAIAERLRSPSSRRLLEGELERSNSGGAREVSLLALRALARLVRRLGLTEGAS